MLVGKELGPYVVEKELGSGAMGTVYRARHSENGDKVAVKLISPAVASNDAALARFTREISILKQLDHPNIVRYRGSGRVHGTPFYIMEYVEGESLDHTIERRGRMTWEEVVTLGEQLCAALQHAHDKGIIHRDLKPSNLMVLPGGVVKLTDFGIAKDTDVTALTAANATVGTASYMSPEQCRGSRDVGPKSDLYSMGVMFYELLTGRKPFTAETVMEMFLKHTKEEPNRPSKQVLDLPVWLDNLVMQLMEKKPEQRPYSAAAVAEALASVREKVEAQQSAGVDAATKRRVDRTKRDKALDDDDKDAARAMLGKKKKKKKAEAFYRQGWFTILALGMVTAVLMALVYVLFIKPPDPDALYARAESTMQEIEKEQDADARLVKLRDARRGVLKEFMDHHPEHAKASKVRAWIDQVDREDTENALQARRGKMAPMNDAERTAREALDLEEKGQLADARQRWREVAAWQEKSDPNERGWGLVGAKHLADLEALDALHDELRSKVSRALILPESAPVPKNAAEKAAIEAVGAERLAKKKGESPLEAARSLWEEVKSRAEGRPELRAYYLLAARQLHAAAAEKKKRS